MDDDVRNVYITSLTFSSPKGKNSILAVGRSNCTVKLWSLNDQSGQVTLDQPSAIACLQFRPIPSRRYSESVGAVVGTEDLLIGDEVGKVYYYSVEWTKPDMSGRNGGRALLIGMINVHSQQICGIAWSPDGEIFATGANDNACCLFFARDILAGVGAQPLPTPTLHRYTTPLMGLIPDFVPNADSHYTLGSLLGTQQQSMYPTYRGTQLPPESAGIQTFKRGTERRRWILAAAVKAIAFVLGRVAC